MAATAAAVGSCFSPSIQTLKCTHVKQHSYLNTPSDQYNSLGLKVPSTRIMLSSWTSSISRSYYYAMEPLSQLGAVSYRRVPRLVSAAVAQEEAAATAPAPPPPPVQEEEKVAAEGGEGGEVAVKGGDDEAAVGEATVNTKLYFGNLPYNVDSAQLAGIIQEHATPELVEVLYHRETGKSRGFAFVTMSSVEDCNAVIYNLDGSQYLGRILRVNFADKPKQKEPLYPETEHKLFIGNLSWSVTSESLTQAFQEYGNVVGGRVLYDGETGKSRGYGFVSYATRSEMETALQSLDGVELEGRAMRVSLAEGRKS